MKIEYLLTALIGFCIGSARAFVFLYAFALLTMPYELESTRYYIAGRPVAIYMLTSNQAEQERNQAEQERILNRHD